MRTLIEEYHTPVLSYDRLIAVHEALLRNDQTCARSSASSSTPEAFRKNARARKSRERASESGLPAEDVVRFGAQAFYDQILERIVKRRPLTAGR